MRVLERAFIYLTASDKDDLKSLNDKIALNNYMPDVPGMNPDMEDDKKSNQVDDNHSVVQENEVQTHLRMGDEKPID